MVVRCTESSGSDAPVNYFCDFGLDDRRLACVYKVDLRADGIDADHFVAVLRQTRCRHRSDVAQSENTDLHSSFLSPTRGKTLQCAEEVSIAHFS